MHEFESLILLFIESLFMGFIMAAPVGPVGILCIRRTLRSGWRAGVTTGLGVAAVDSLFGLLASLSLTTVSEFLAREQDLIRQVGGVVLLVIGVQIYRSKVATEPDDRPENHGRNFLSAFLMAITNPLTILSFAAVFVSSGLAGIVGHRVDRIALFVLGIFGGSTLWWIFLSRLTWRWQKRMTPARMLWINRGCGFVIGIFGVVSLAKIF